MQKDKREITIALLLISLTLICVVIGFVNSKRTASMVKGQVNGSLSDSLKHDQVMVLAFEGPIYDTFQTKSPFKSALNAASLKEELLKAKEDDSVKAVLIRFNSPGGTVAASQEIYQLVRDLRKDKKAVVISMSDVCASGCYYISSAADAIVANPGTLTGSIGVIMQGLNYKGLFEKFGVRDQTFKAGKFKDLGSGARDLTPEERQVMQNLLDDTYDQFLSDIVDGRKMDRAKLEKLAQGLIYTGRKAQEAGLVDYLGSYEDAKKITLDILKDKYGYKRISSLKFNENWEKKKISGLEEILDLGFGSKANSTSQLENKLNQILSDKQEPFAQSKFQMFYLLQ